MERQTGRQTDRGGERETDPVGYREADRDRGMGGGWRHTHTYTETDRQTDRQTDRHKNILVKG